MVQLFHDALINYSNALKNHFDDKLLCSCSLVQRSFLIISYLRGIPSSSFGTPFVFSLLNVSSCAKDYLSESLFGIVSRELEITFVSFTCSAITCSNLSVAITGSNLPEVETGAT